MAVDDPQYHENKFLVALAKHLGLDPTQIAGMSITQEGSSPVEIQWDGYALLPVEEFNKILDTTNQGDVVWDEKR